MPSEKICDFFTLKNTIWVANPVTFAGRWSRKAGNLFCNTKYLK